jgi:hypothetical protein
MYQKLVYDKLFCGWNLDVPLALSFKKLAEGHELSSLQL